jgi:hypothetical protein
MQVERDEGGQDVQERPPPFNRTLPLFHYHPFLRTHYDVSICCCSALILMQCLFKGVPSRTCTC